MSKPLDLNNPPAGATHWDADPSRSASFMMWTGEQWYFWPPTSDKPEWCRWNREGDHSTFHIRPLPAAAPVWNGPEDGLPPVGLEVEYEPKAGDADVWRKGHVIAHLRGGIVVADGNGDHVELCYDNYRPIRTAEQLAAEEREQQIEMMTAVISQGFRECKKLADVLYDAGARMPGEGSKP